MADKETDPGPAEAPDDTAADVDGAVDADAAVDVDVEDAGVGASDEAVDDATEEINGAGVEVEADGRPDADRIDLKVIQARKSLEEEAEAARRRVLGSRRARRGPATLVAPGPPADDADLSEQLHQLVRGVEAETERLQEDVFRLRSAAGRAGATLGEEIQRAADELVGETTTESLETLAATIDTLQETAGTLGEVAAGLRTTVEQLANVGPVAEQLAELAAAPPTIPDALANILGDLTEQLSALGDAVSTQVQGSLEEALTAELARHDARIEHALARVVDELARLRRRLPVSRKGAAVDLTKDQLEGIGKAVGDYLLAAMREQKT